MALDPRFQLSLSTVEQAELVAQAAQVEEVPSLEDILPQYNAAVEAAAAAEAQAIVVHKAFTKTCSALSTAPDDHQARAKAIAKAQATVDKAAEACAVAQAAVDRLRNVVIQAAGHYYEELRRDKRSEHDLACPTWAPVDFEMVDPVDGSRRTRVQMGPGCKCEHLPVPHSLEKGRPWCPTEQGAHHADTPLCEFPTREQFVRRFTSTVSE